jgi:hypothetical protein
VAEVGHQREVEEHAAPAPLFDPELAQRLEERQRLDVSHRAADLGDHEVEIVLLGDEADAALDLVGDVRDDLDRAAEVVPTPLAPDDRVVDRARGDVRPTRGVDVGEALVVAEVEVRLRAVLGDEDLAVLERAHRARIDVDVRVELLEGDAEPARYEEATDGGGCDPLAERRDHAPGNEDELGLLAGFRHAGSFRASLVDEVPESARSATRSSGTRRRSWLRG